MRIDVTDNMGTWDNIEHIKFVIVGFGKVEL